jgi:hypothetical protein
MPIKTVGLKIVWFRQVSLYTPYWQMQLQILTEDFYVN